MPFLRPRLALLALSGPILLSTAGDAAPVRKPVATRELGMAPGTFNWLSQGPYAGPIYMVISIDRQMVHVYSGDNLIGAAAVSTGKAGHGTPTGDFPILQKRQYHRSNLYSNAPMPFMQRLTWDGIALHAGHNPGYPASHGCIRLPYAFAQRLFTLTKIGTPVEVTRDRLSPALKLDTLVLTDPGSAIVTFDRATNPLRALPPPTIEDGVPMLDIDPAIFGAWRRR